MPPSFIKKFEGRKKLCTLFFFFFSTDIMTIILKWFYRGNYRFSSGECAKVHLESIRKSQASSRYPVLLSLKKKKIYIYIHTYTYTHIYIHTYTHIHTYISQLQIHLTLVKWYISGDNCDKFPSKMLEESS